MQTVHISVVRDGAPDPAIQGPADIAPALIERIGHLDREHFVCVHLDARNRPTEYETVSIGTLTASIVHPREVFKSAIVGNAASIILAHNHPSGELTPSADDLALTKRLCEVGELLGIEVLDHLVIGTDDHLSMKDRGLI